MNLDTTFHVNVGRHQYGVTAVNEGSCSVFVCIISSIALPWFVHVVIIIIGFLYSAFTCACKHEVFYTIIPQPGFL